MLMTPDSPRSITGRTVAGRRAMRVAAAASMVTALVATAAVPAFAAPAPLGDPNGALKTSASKKLGAADEERLAEAEAKGEKAVTFMVATAPGATEQVTAQIEAVDGAFVGQRYDKLGYVRATVPTAKAESVLTAATKLSSVRAIDLKHEVVREDPTPGTGVSKGAARTAKKVAAVAPDKNTPARNHYNPSFETGAVDFVKQNPKYDGRGVTIGILDSGVDIAHPALQKTTTGERKIVDWVTATDPVLDPDATWRPMVTKVTGPSFTAGGRTYKAPKGNWNFNTFAERATLGGDMNGDLNRDGDITDTWGLLYDPTTLTVRVDLDNNGDFTNDTVMKPYKSGFQVGYFGKDNPATPVAERIPFTIEVRQDVKLNPRETVSAVADFVNIGIIEGAHGSHVAGITAANGLFGGAMDGAAPGAKLVSSRACNWSGGCTSTALFEGLADLVINRNVDIVNISIGGLPALNDGNNARAELYNRLIDIYGVQLVISAGNDGPGTNTIGDPGVADKAISVGASITKDTWAANYGSVVTKKNAMLPFSSRGPREDGGFTPTITAPGAAINTTQTWSNGGPVAEAGYALPPGYSMLQGTSMSSPQTAGAGALLLSAAKQRKIDLTPANLRTALTSTANKIPGVKAHEQGSGMVDVIDAWDSIRNGVTAHEYTVKAPVDTAIDFALKTPGFGTGLYDREGGLEAGSSRTYDITVTRTTGPKGAVWHNLSWKYNDGTTFRLLNGDRVRLPLNQPVTVTVQARPKTAGVHSGILQVDDPRTEGTDKQILSTVIVSTPLGEPGYSFTDTGSVQRNSHKSYFLTVPPGTKTLEVALGGLAANSQTRFISIHPYGTQMEDSSTIFCYPNFNHPLNTCRPDLRSYVNPTPGVWEIEVESRRTSPLLDNPYTLDVSLLGAEFDPAVRTLPEAKVGTPAPVEWTVTNKAAAIEGKLAGGNLGSANVERPKVTTSNKILERTVTIGEGVERLDVVIGNTSDPAADLDLSVLRGSAVVGSSADGDSEESVTLNKPAAGTYRIVVDGYALPNGSTDFDYRDVFFSSTLGEVKVDSATPVSLAPGASATVAGQVVAAGLAPEGRQLFGEVRVLNARGTTAGAGSVAITKVIP
ncbi:S8 family serine peptidase [Streptomyces sp. NPDC057638]|uniref:S8 family serine peptidase n=1 Tax=Streptomyces sp. NPDC057638 TaxID=3346190 RepID=UPI0036A3F913